LTRVCFLLEISFRQLQVCNFVEPSLTRGRVCKLLYNCFWALPEQPRRNCMESQLRQQNKAVSSAGLRPKSDFSLLQIFKYTTCFGLTGHLHVYDLVRRSFKVTITAAGWCWLALRRCVHVPYLRS
jgi:hypothetical protein